jgi:UDP-N-acetylmuramate dehydrogenase
LQKTRDYKLKIIENELMSKHTTYRIGGPAAYFCEPADIEELKECLEFASSRQLPYKIIVNGSNLLIADRGLDYLIIKLRHLKNLEINGNVCTAGAGLGLHQLIDGLADMGMGGFELLSWIPGSLAGALVMNAGAYGISIGHFVQSVQVVNPSGDEIELTKDELNFGYRRSIFHQEDKLIIVGAKIEVAPADSALLRKTIDDIRERRKKHPSEPSAGSVFKNPPGKFAGEIIEELGLKGARLGNARISLEHANFIVNAGDASASDVRGLMDLIQTRALSRGINLEPEVRLWGF